SERKLRLSAAAALRKQPRKASPPPRSRHRYIEHVEVVSHEKKNPRSCRAIKIPRTEPPPGVPHLEPLLPALSL
ncbi:hypothetical protein BHE74_00012733, partial [Ensete ventricosum]